MLQQRSSLTRLIAAGLAAAAIAPAAAVAVPIDNGPGVTRDFRNPDQVTPGNHGTPSNGAPQWPINPRPIAPAKPTATTTTPDTGGIDTVAWIGIGGGALVATAGLGLVGLKRLRTTRQRQLA
jgi:hypothetical protein